MTIVEIAHKVSKYDLDKKMDTAKKIGDDIRAGKYTGEELRQIEILDRWLGMNIFIGTPPEDILTFK